MSEEERNRQEEQEIFQLVKRYEDMIAKDESYFFDVDQFECLIEYYLEKNRLKQAVKVLKYAHDLFPDSTVLMLREAQLLAASGKLSRAIPRLRNLLAFEPFNEELHLTLASIYSQQRDHQKAIFHYEEAIKLGDGEIANEICIDLAMEHENRNDYESAISVLKDALARNPENETATYELAYCYEMSGKTEEGAEYYQLFLDEHPYSFTAWYNLGNAFQKLELSEKAVEAYDFCLAIEENFGPAYFNKANVLIKLEEHSKAISCYLEAMKVEGESATTFCMIGECFEQLEDYSHAEHYYRRALEKDSGFPDAFVGLGVLKDLTGNPAAAIPFFEKAMMEDPANGEYVLMAAAVFKKCERIDEAEKLYLELLDRDPHYEEAWIEYSELLVTTDRLEKAIEQLDEGIAQIQESVALRFRKVAYLHRDLHPKEAYSLLESLLDKHFEHVSELTEYYPEIEKEKTFSDLINLYKTKK